MILTSGCSWLWRNADLVLHPRAAGRDEDGSAGDDQEGLHRHHAGPGGLQRSQRESLEVRRRRVQRLQQSKK